VSTSQAFEVVEPDGGCLAANYLGRTVATISSHGNIDWLLRATGAAGPKITRIGKETTLDHVLGLN
jgi:hypothetical protein